MHAEWNLEAFTHITSNMAIRALPVKGKEVVQGVWDRGNIQAGYPPLKIFGVVK